MPATKPTTARVGLPKELEQLINQGIERMSEKELREFEKQAEKIMKDSTGNIKGTV